MFSLHKTFGRKTTNSDPWIIFFVSFRAVSFTLANDYAALGKGSPGRPAEMVRIPDSLCIAETFRKTSSALRYKSSSKLIDFLIKQTCTSLLLRKSVAFNHFMFERNLNAWTLHLRHHHLLVQAVRNKENYYYYYLQAIIFGDGSVEIHRLTKQLFNMPADDLDRMESFLSNITWQPTNPPTHSFQAVFFFLYTVCLKIKHFNPLSARIFNVFGLGY